MFLDELTTEEFADKVDENTVVMVPIGAVEEHGAHLPLCTDSLQPEFVAQEVAKRIDVLIAPPLRYGNCSTTRNFPGTISLSFDTVRALAYDLLSELIRNGFKKIVLLSGHAGNMHMCALRLAARDVVEERDALVMVVSDYEILYRSKKVAEDDGHSGLLETSRILAIRPDLVREARPKGENKMPPFVVLRHPEKYWDGVSGDSSGSTAAKGEGFNEFVIGEICRMIEDLRVMR